MNSTHSKQSILFNIFCRRFQAATDKVGDNSQNLQQEWLGYLGAVFTATSDQLAQALAYAVQLKYESLDVFTNDIIKVIQEEDAKRAGKDD